MYFIILPSYSDSYPKKMWTTFLLLIYCEGDRMEILFDLQIFYVDELSVSWTFYQKTSLCF